MKYFLLLSLLLSTLAFGSADRYLEAKFLTNNGAVITLPTSSMSFSGATAISGSNTGDVTLGTASGLSLSGQVLSLQLATTSLSGALSSTDWNIFNGKLTSSLANGSVFIGSAGGVATAQTLTGDVTVSNAGVTAIGSSKVIASMLNSGASASGTVATSNGSGGVTYSAIPSTAPSTSGTDASPTVVTAGGGVVFSGSNYSNLYFISAASAITISANPQISAGTLVGQRLVLISKSATNTITLSDGSGLSLNGPWVGGLDSSIELIWNGNSKWVEMSRR